MLHINLIGPPAVIDPDGRLTGPRGRKAWALLGRIARSEDRLSRRQLVDEMFTEADDPMAALRWNLAELRRTLGFTESFVGDPIDPNFPDSVRIDASSPAETVRDGRLPTGDFLEGIDVGATAEFETWLLVERQRVDAEILAALHQAALRALSIGRYDDAIAIGRCAVGRAPLEEGSHILLVKALANSGDRASAEEHVAACRRLFEAELGVEPSAGVMAAARPGVADPVPGVSARASATSLLDAGLAALAAGAGDAGVECLRRSVADAERSADRRLVATAMFELGSALVHAVRGYDHEGAVVLAAALEAAAGAGDDTIATKALTELAYVDSMAGRRTNAAGSLAEAERLADGDPLLLAAISGFAGMNLSDWGRLDESIAQYERSIEFSRRAGNARREIWATGVGAVPMVAAGRIEEARSWIDRSLELCESERWTAFKPWPVAWHGRIDLLDGAAAEPVRHDMEANLALATQLGDPCWEGVSAEAIGLTHRAEGRLDHAIEWMARGRALCGRVSDRYVWFQSQILRTEAETAVEAGDEDLATALTDQLIVEAARGQMDGLLEDALRIRTELLQSS